MTTTIVLSMLDGNGISQQYHVMFRMVSIIILSSLSVSTVIDKHREKQQVEHNRAAVESDTYLPSPSVVKWAIKGIAATDAYPDSEYVYGPSESLIPPFTCHDTPPTTALRP
jgi:hypothetical protein